MTDAVQLTNARPIAAPTMRQGEIRRGHACCELGRPVSAPHLSVVIERFRAVCLADERILAAGLFGSLACGAGDAYSDIDLFVVIRQTSCDAFGGACLDFLARLGKPVYARSRPCFGHRELVFCLDNGANGELHIGCDGRLEDLCHGPHQVLVDKAGVLEGLSFPYYRTPSEWQRRNLRQRLESFWFQAFLAGSVLGRGRLLEAAECLANMQRELRHICRLSADFADDGGYPPDDLVLAGRLAELASTYPHLEKDEMLVACQAAMSLAEAVGRLLADAQGVAYPAEMEKLALTRFASLMGQR